MWPFGQKREASRLAAIPVGETRAVAVLTTVVSENVVTSPVSGLASALLQVDLLERVSPGHAGRQDGTLDDDFNHLGRATFGQVLILRDGDGDEISVVGGRARFEPSTQTGGNPITKVPPELVPFLRRATGRGVLCCREATLRTGDRVLLKAVVQPTLRVVTAGYRSGTNLSYVTRDDLAPVVLVEVVDAPAW
ncbi:MAG TPA: hypothetical protein VLT33_29765 [Labilithrix sp.]|nr:hypothetical protein [Labilithrix sp.]